MKILQIVPSVSLIYGGPSQMVLGLSQALAVEGIDVTLITTNSNGDTGQAPLDVPLGKEIEQDGYKVIYFPCYPFRRYKFSLPLLQWLGSNAKQYDLAHIHALFSPVSTAAATIARQQKLPYIMRPLGTLDPADLQKKKQLKQIYGLLLEKPNLAGASGIHFTSQEEAKISERYGTHTPDIVIPLGVNIPESLPPLGKMRQELDIAPEIPIILFMSRIDPKKGLDLLLPALETLHQEAIKFHFILAGTNPQDPDYENSIAEKIKQSSLNSIITITGFVTGETKLGLLQDADIFVLPSYYENFGIAVAEAMATGTPVVISDRVHIWQEIESAAAGWISSCELSQLTQTLRQVLLHPENWQEKAMNARNLVQNQYSWNAIAKRMIEAYQEILN